MENTVKPPLVSVIVTVFNVEKYIQECMESITAQTYSNLEIICVDDCGTDNSMDFVRQIALTDPRIKIISHPHNKGGSAARNSGFDISTGQFILFVDSDDFLDVTMIEKTVGALITSKAESCVVRYKYWKDGSVYNKNESWNWQKDAEGEYSLNFETSKRIFQGSPVTVWNRLIRRDFLVQNGIRHPEISLYEDNHLALCITFLSSKMIFINEALYYYRIRKGSIMDGLDDWKEYPNGYIETFAYSAKFLSSKGLPQLPPFILDYLIAVMPKFNNRLLHKRKWMESLQAFIRNTDFPDGFYNCDYYVRACIIKNYKYKGDLRILYPFVRMLSKVVPIRKYRRYIRDWIQVYI